MIGKKFGRLTVLEECKERKDNKRVYKCLCECGNITNVIGTHLRSGKVKSCKCLRGDVHGKSRSRLYRIYCNMKTRCYNKNNIRYKDYGERGINICNEWLNDFMSFYEWSMNNGYADSLTIDRIDNNKGYSPNNCRWVNQITQSNNTRNNVYLTYNEKTQTMSQWAKDLHLKSCTVRMRHYRGYTDKECLFGKEVKREKRKI